MSDDGAVFHRKVAREMMARYAVDAHAPAGWRETLVWHWVQAGEFGAAVDGAIAVAEAMIAQLDFASARRWVERALEYMEKLQKRRAYELRAYSAALAVLEFGGQYREALGYAERMVRAARQHGGRQAQAHALVALGRMQRELNQLPQAEMTLAEALALAETEDAGAVEAEVHFHLAKVYQLQGRHMEALEGLQAAQEEHVQADDRIKLARVLTGMGDVYRALAASREALVFYQKALGLEQGRASPLGQAMLKDKIALALLAEGRMDEAELVGREGLLIREQIGDTVGLARSNSLLGMVAQRLGHTDRAIEHYERARALEEQTQNVRGQHVSLLHLGDAYVALRRYAEAGGYYRRALALAQHTGDQVALARTLEHQGDLLQASESQDAAERAWAEALRIRQGLGHAEEAAALRRRLGYMAMDSVDR
ncbi:tetratricopeptide repeat protein [Chloroflexia bacterium SDU3-3]|nr:tetratricopeptide repeat protein [Chloroflexia bacterium SDU3-3]